MKIKWRKLDGLDYSAAIFIVLMIALMVFFIVGVVKNHSQCEALHGLLHDGKCYVNCAVVDQ